MEKEEKKTEVSGVYLVLAALTVLFAVSLVFLHKTAYEGASHGNYTVTTQDKTDEITAPTRASCSSHMSSVGRSDGFLAMSLSSALRWLSVRTAR